MNIFKIKIHILAVFISLAFAAGPISAQIPVGLFELDANGVANGEEDWSPDPSGTFTGIQVDNDEQTFAGGAKEIRQYATQPPQNGPFTKWITGGNVTGKANLKHTYAVAKAFINSNGDPDIAVFWGADRQTADGTISFSFCLYENPIAPDLATDGLFTAEKVVGDICVFVDVLGNQGGGIVNNIIVRSWNGNGLTDETAENAALCVDNGGFYQDICAISNTSTLDLPWRPETLEPGEFVEGVIRLGAFGIGCISSASIITSQSNSTTDQVDDFRFFDFPICSIKTTKVCNTVEVVDPSIPTFLTEVTVTVENDGGAAFSSSAVIEVTDAAGTVFDDGNDFTVTRTVSDLTGPMSGDGSNGFQTNEKLDVLANGLTITGSYVSTSNGGMNSAKATITDGLLTVSSSVATVQCTALNLSSGLFIEKDCDNIMLTTKDLDGTTDLGLVGVKLDYDIRACNTGDFDIDANIADPTVGEDVMDIILAAGVLCDTVTACPEGSACVGFDDKDNGDPSDDDPGVCVNTMANPDGEDGPDGSGGTIQVCERLDGTYLLEALAGDAMTAMPFNAIFSNTATVTASEADNPLLDTTGEDDGISESATANCPLCDADGDGMPDYIDGDSGP